MHVRGVHTWWGGVHMDGRGGAHMNREGAWTAYGGKCTYMWTGRGGVTTPFPSLFACAPALPCAPPSPPFACGRGPRAGCVGPVRWLHMHGVMMPALVCRLGVVVHAHESIPPHLDACAPCLHVHTPPPPPTGGSQGGRVPPSPCSPWKGGAHSKTRGRGHIPQHHAEERGADIVSASPHSAAPPSSCHTPHLQGAREGHVGANRGLQRWGGEGGKGGCRSKREEQSLPCHNMDTHILCRFYALFCVIFITFVIVLFTPENKIQKRRNQNWNLNFSGWGWEYQTGSMGLMWLGKDCHWHVHGWPRTCEGVCFFANIPHMYNFCDAPLGEGHEATGGISIKNLNC